MNSGCIGILGDGFDVLSFSVQKFALRRKNETCMKCKIEIVCKNAEFIRSVPCARPDQIMIALICLWCIRILARFGGLQKHDIVLLLSIF